MFSLRHLLPVARVISYIQIFLTPSFTEFKALLDRYESDNTEQIKYAVTKQETACLGLWRRLQRSEDVQQELQCGESGGSDSSLPFRVCRGR